LAPLEEIGKKKEENWLGKCEGKNHHGSTLNREPFSLSRFSFSFIFEAVLCVTLGIGKRTVNLISLLSLSTLGLHKRK
jgi:hypothetical protein